MVIIIILLALFSGLFATDELIVYPNRGTGTKFNNYGSWYGPSTSGNLTGGGRDAWRIGGVPGIYPTVSILPCSPMAPMHSGIPTLHSSE